MANEICRLELSCLWAKLLACDIKGKIMKLIFNLYQNTKACVKLNNELSKLFTALKNEWLTKFADLNYHAYGLNY